MSDMTGAVIISLLLINLVGLLMVGVRINSQQRDSQGMDRRLTLLEANVANMPTHRDLLQLRRDISEVVETAAAIRGQTEAMTQMMRTIQEHLLENDR